jgi:hypothetical protein
MAESSEEGCDSKTAILPMMMMMIIIIMKWKKAVITYFRILSQNFLEGLRKTTIHFFQDWSLYRDMNQIFPE